MHLQYNGLYFSVFMLFIYLFFYVQELWLKEEMAGGAAGGFLTRAFEAILKECSGKKFTSLQTAVQAYLGSYPFLCLS